MELPECLRERGFVYPLIEHGVHNQLWDFRDKLDSERRLMEVMRTPLRWSERMLLDNIFKELSE